MAEGETKDTISDEGGLRRVMTLTDNPSLQISPVKLDGSNYLIWSRSCGLAIAARRLTGYITGSLPLPDGDASLHTQWISENALVMTWLINSMQPTISRSFLLLDTAHKIWTAAAQMYSQQGNDAQAYELRKKLRSLDQKDRSLAVYYAELSSLWQELDYYQSFQAVCSQDATLFQQTVEKERVYDFLAGLNLEYDQIRVQVLGRSPFPTLREAYALVQQEESRRSAMVHSSIQDRSALAVTPPSRAPRPSPVQSGSQGTLVDRDRLKCDYCGKDRHDREHCWKLNGRPTRGRGRGSTARPQAHVSEIAVSPSEPNTLSQDELHTLRRLMARLDSPSTTVSSTSASSNFANTGIPASALSTLSSPSWIIDSGATDHMTGASSLFYSYSPCSGRDKVRVADGTLSSVSGKGSVHCSSLLSLSSVLHVPTFSTNLLSVSSLTTSLNCSVTFFPTHCVFQDLATGKTIGNGRAQGGLYFLDAVPPVVPSQALKCTIGSSLSLLHQWHRRLGHPSFNVLEKLFPSLVRDCPRSIFGCDACELAKHKRTCYPSINKRSTFPFMLIHTDVWGPSPVVSTSGYRWFVTFIDCFSRVTWIYLLRTKSEVFSCFQTFHKMVTNLFNAQIKILRSDNGTEYVDGVFRAYLEEHGILYQTSCVGTPQQNGVAERKNGHLLEVARSLLFTMNVPKSFWGDAVLTAAYLINRMPSSVLQFQIPIQLLPVAYPTSSLPPRVFGCVCFVHLQPRTRGKLDPKAVRCVFIGYSATQKGYKCYDPHTRKVYVSMDVTFREAVSFFPSPPPSPPGESSGMDEIADEEMAYQHELSFFLPSQRTIICGEGEPNSSLDVEPDISGRLDRADFKTYSRRPKEQASLVPPNPSSSLMPVPGNASQSIPLPVVESPVVNDSSLPIALRKGVRACTQHPISKFVSYDSLSSTYRAFVSSLSSACIPQGWTEAINDPKWKVAMVEEMQALSKNNTWELVSLPSGKKPVGCKWVFTIKQKADGTIERYKARLVAKGFTQTYGIDYQETFAPVAKMNSIRAILSCAANLGWPLQQLDVKNAFLHGDLEEEVYMDIPPGFSSQSTVGKVCRLKKALYGLKQSPRAWFDRFLKAMLRFGYKQSNADHTMFVKRHANKVTVLIVYVDDIVVTGNDEEEVTHLKMLLAKEFEIKDLGSLRYFLGIEVARSDKGIFLSQRKYILDLLEETGMLGCRPADSPIEANHHLCSGVGDLVEKERYQRLVGRLIYLSHTRPDIAYAVGIVSQFMHEPRAPHLDAVYRILRYLKSAPGKGILFSNHGHLRLEAFTDADWAGSIDDRRSTSGYCAFVGGNLVTWRSKKQTVVSRSSAEAEYRAMAHGTCELMWLQSLLNDIGFVCSEPLTLYCDNKAAISIAHNPVQHDRTKHIEIDRHFIKEKLNKGFICMPFVKSANQLADVFTKGLSSKVFHPICCKLGMRDIFAPT
ncbi:unnamed protein product [Camellia sinensis]